MFESQRSIEAVLHRPPTTTPSYGDDRATGNVPGLRPNPGMLRALLQPILFLKLLEPVGAFEVGDIVTAQFWGEGRVMLTPLPAEASRGRIPTTFPANQIHAEIAGPDIGKQDDDTATGRLDYWPELPSGTTVVDDAEDQFKIRRAA